MIREITCICCPLGCRLQVEEEHPERVSGNSCPRGAQYGKNEVTDPRRTVTASVPVTGGALSMVSVKTSREIPKDRIFDCMEKIHALRVSAPVKIGDVLLSDCAGTGADIVATKTVDKMEKLSKSKDLFTCLTS